MLLFKFVLFTATNTLKKMKEKRNSSSKYVLNPKSKIYNIKLCSDSLWFCPGILYTPAMHAKPYFHNVIQRQINMDPMLLFNPI